MSARVAVAHCRSMSGRGQPAELPHVDEHAVEVAASAQLVWRALLGELPGDGRARRLAARLLGCRERTATGRPGEPGSTLVGFRIVRAAPPAELALAGEHRLSRYSLTFRIAELDETSRSLLRARTGAAFPGPHGRAYRALVIASGMHARVMRGLLARIARRAEAASWDGRG